MFFFPKKIERLDFESILFVLQMKIEIHFNNTLLYKHFKAQGPEGISRPLQV